MNTQPSSPQPTSRRQFLKTSTAAAVGGIFAANLSFPEKGFAANSDTLRVGLIGCGGRGTGAANQALNADSNVILTAMGDVFEDRLQGSLKALQAEAKEKVQVTPDKCFVGFDAYQKVIDSGVDVVILTTPPGFRPYHLKAAVDAGKHVFCEKPVAVDAPGVRSVLESAAKAKKNNKALVSGFCWRYHYPKRETFQRVLGGDIGNVISIYNTYNTGPIWSHPRQPDWSDMVYHLRNWYYFAWLSGDHLVEQAVHSIDMMSWAMGDVPPLRVTATGGRQVRTEDVFGHIFDHFAIAYEYENGAKGFHFSRQQANTSPAYSVEIGGSKGNCLVDCRRNIHAITGEKEWRYKEKNVPDMYQVEHNELFASIRKGEPINNGVWMAHSTLIAIMGRMAAYTGQTISWDEALNSKEDLVKLVTGQENIAGDPKFDWNMKLTPPPVAMPGRTKFV